MNEVDNINRMAVTPCSSGTQAHGPLTPRVSGGQVDVGLAEC